METQKLDAGATKAALENRIAWLGAECEGEKPTGVVTLFLRYPREEVANLYGEQFKRRLKEWLRCSTRVWFCNMPNWPRTLLLSLVDVAASSGVRVALEVPLLMAHYLRPILRRDVMKARLNYEVWFRMDSQPATVTDAPVSIHLCGGNPYEGHYADYPRLGLDLQKPTNTVSGPVQTALPADYTKDVTLLVQSRDNRLNVPSRKDQRAFHAEFGSIAGDEEIARLWNSVNAQVCGVCGKIHEKYTAAPSEEPAPASAQANPVQTPVPSPSVSTHILVKTSFVGFHCWPEAPEEVKFLRELHRHQFGVKLILRVSEVNDSRELEFFMVKSRLDHLINTVILPYLEQAPSTSCETMARVIAQTMREFYNVPEAQVFVDEDGENAAIVGVRV